MLTFNFETSTQVHRSLSTSDKVCNRSGPGVVEARLDARLDTSSVGSVDNLNTLSRGSRANSRRSRSVTSAVNADSRLIKDSKLIKDARLVKDSRFVKDSRLVKDSAGYTNIDVFCEAGKNNNVHKSAIDETKEYIATNDFNTNKDTNDPTIDIINPIKDSGNPTKDSTIINFDNTNNDITNNGPSNTNNGPSNTNNGPSNTNNGPSNTNNGPSNTNKQPSNTNKDSEHSSKESNRSRGESSESCEYDVIESLECCSFRDDVAGGASSSGSNSPSCLLLGHNGQAILNRCCREENSIFSQLLSLGFLRPSLDKPALC